MYYNMKKEGKLIIVSAPSGSGKSTIINFLLEKDLNLEFSISATSRSPRGEEMNGREYYFLSPEDFRNKINNDEFLEYEEVYKEKYYGTLKSEVERLISEGKNGMFDVDVVGGINIKKFYGDKAISVFIQPPSIDALRDRLQSRATDTPEAIATRLDKAEFELSLAPQFDVIIVNDILENAQQETYMLLNKFINE